jgi:hypothetical protein
MDPTLIILGIQATLRAAQAGADLYGEHARDHKVFLPNLKLPGGSREEQLILFLKDKPPNIAPGNPLYDIWNAEREGLRTSEAEKIDAAYMAMLQHKAKLQFPEEYKNENVIQRESDMLAAGRMVEQWREDRKPPNAFIRMALTLTDIGLEFVSSNPSILGVGSRGERLIEGFAQNMTALIPNEVAAFGPKTDFTDRVLGIFLRSGLGTLASNASIVFKDDDIAKLLQGVTKPIVDALPDNIAEQLHYRELVDALAGPSAEAAFKLLAKNTETYLGKDFANDRALGAVTSALFGEISDTAHTGSIVNVFSKQGVILLYQAGLGVAVERPELFIGDDDSAKTELFRDLLIGAANTLRTYPRFNGPVGASLAAMLLEVVGQNAPGLLKLHPDNPWEKVAVALLENVTGGLAEAFNNDGSLKGALKSFSDGQLLELLRVILEQVTLTPGMLGIDRSEVQAIVAGIAEVMAADDTLLLSTNEWVKIAGVAAQKAAANPGRLFGLSAANTDDALAVTLIKAVLKVAGNTWTADGRSDQPLLFGETLASAIETLIGALAGNVAAVSAQPDLVDQFLNNLLEKASAKPEQFGSEGLLKVFRSFIGRVLANGTLPSDDEIENALAA